MSFFYPHTVEIRRVKTTSSVGARSYSQHSAAADEDTIIATLKCRLQMGGGGKGRAGVPTDSNGAAPTHTLLVPKSAGLAEGAILAGDVIVDATGKRYTISTPYRVALGWQIGCKAEAA